MTGLSRISTGCLERPIDSLWSVLSWAALLPYAQPGLQTSILGHAVHPPTYCASRRARATVERMKVVHLCTIETGAATRLHRGLRQVVSTPPCSWRSAERRIWRSRCSRPRPTCQAVCGAAFGTRASVATSLRIGRRGPRRTDRSSMTAVRTGGMPCPVAAVRRAPFAHDARSHRFRSALHDGAEGGPGDPHASRYDVLSPGMGAKRAALDLVPEGRSCFGMSRSMLSRMRSTPTYFVRGIAVFPVTCSESWKGEAVLRRYKLGHVERAVRTFLSSRGRKRTRFDAFLGSGGM